MKKKIRIVLRSNDYQQLDKAIKEIVRTVKRTGSNIFGPIPIPNRIKYFTVLRSPNNDKKSREQFEIITYKRLLDIEILNSFSSNGVEETMNALMKLYISPAVDVEIK